MSNKVLQLPIRQGDYTVGAIGLPTAATGEVLIKVEAVGLNSVEWKIKLSGLMKEEYPAVLGLEGAGTVEAVGEGVSRFAKGDRVLFVGNFSNRYSAFKQYTVQQADFVSKIPDTLSFEEAATIPVGLGTAAFSLFNQDETASAYSAALYPPWEADGRGKYSGRPLVVLGGSGSVGQNILMLGKLAGFSPIIATASPHNFAFVKELGATHVLDRKIPVDILRAEIRKITTAPVDLVYDAVGVDETQRVGYALLDRGVLIVVVPHTNAPEAPSPEKAVKGALATCHEPFNVSVARSLYHNLLSLLEESVIKPNRVEVIPGGFAGVALGLAKLQQNKVSAAKLVVHPFETP